MRNYGMAACMLIAIAAVGGAVVEHSNSAVAQAPSSPAAWEYHVIDADNDRGIIGSRCRDAGREGWEMCGVVPRGLSPHILIFKRLKRD